MHWVLLEWLDVAGRSNGQEESRLLFSEQCFKRGARKLTLHNFSSIL